MHAEADIADIAAAQAANDPAERLLLEPEELHAAESVLHRPSPVPRRPGVYAWYFEVVPPGVPVEGCHVVDGRPLLYVGISPKGPAADGRVSRQSLGGGSGNTTEGSTLRLSLGSLLVGELGLARRRVGSGKRMTFCRDGEEALSRWMAAYARVVWAPVESPWRLEEQLIERLVLPLNLDQNRHSAFHSTLSEARRRQRNAARALPVVT